MSSRLPVLAAILLSGILPTRFLGAPLSTEQIAAQARPSLVTLSSRGRDGSSDGVGTGFIVDPSGLVATSLHVIGEGRPFTVRLASGEAIEVLGIHAWDRQADLAVIRIARTNLSALPLGISSNLVAGSEVVALGNPLGLADSVVAGVLSARRVLEEIEMLQVALPIEPGNSGGPLLDREGRVQGIVNAKSLLTRNLGFATPIDLLQPLLQQPHPVPYSRWIRTGTLDGSGWEPRLGARWRQRAGRIEVEGTGAGFGGRSFVLRTEPAPELPYEVSVSVRLDDEAGAAGLVFGGDDDGMHYGFYPTGGQLRLTAFEGPDVFSWRILGTVPSTQYRPGDWNELRVRLEADRIQCWVNGQEVFNLTDGAFAGRRVGLAKFRDTGARFRSFRSGASLGPAPSLDPSLILALGGVEIPSSRVSEADRIALRAQLPVARAYLDSRARQLEREAARLRQLATSLHQDQIRDDLVRELAKPEGEIRLAHAALLIARLDDPELDIAVYERQLDALGSELNSQLAPDLDPAGRLDALRRFLFEENGFHGSRHDYYNRANSYLSDVLDDREGLPITLSLVFLELAGRIGLAHVHGVPLPGHFLVRHAPPDGSPRLIDVFHGGRLLTHSDADELGSEFAGIPIRSEFLRPATPREIIVRMLTNLQAFTERSEGAAASLRFSNLLVAVAGEARAEAAQRIDRARLRSQTGDLDGAQADFKWILDAAPPGLDLERVAEMHQRLVNAQR